MADLGSQKHAVLGCLRAEVTLLPPIPQELVIRILRDEAQHVVHGKMKETGVHGQPQPTARSSLRSRTFWQTL